MQSPYCDSAGPSRAIRKQFKEMQRNGGVVCSFLYSSALGCSDDDFEGKEGI